MPMQLSPDGRETLEDALRIFVETAGDEVGRENRRRSAAALRAELSGHPMMAAAVRARPDLVEAEIDRLLRRAAEGDESDGN
jgi:hypothetical protein